MLKLLLLFLLFWKKTTRQEQHRPEALSTRTQGGRCLACTTRRLPRVLKTRLHHGPADRRHDSSSRLSRAVSHEVTRADKTSCWHLSSEERQQKRKAQIQRPLTGCRPQETSRAQRASTVELLANSRRSDTKKASQAEGRRDATEARERDTIDTSKHR